MITPREIIQKKRDRRTLTAEEIQTLIQGYLSTEVADYHIAAWLMAVFLNGMKIDETVALTRSMLSSGMLLNLSSIKAKKVDKHSTGGVGDKTSMIVAQLLQLVA